MTLNYTQYLLKPVSVQSHNTENSLSSFLLCMCELYLLTFTSVFTLDITDGLFQVTSLLLRHLTFFVIVIYLHSRTAMQVFPHGSGKRYKSFHLLSPVSVFQVLQDNVCLFT